MSMERQMIKVDEAAEVLGICRMSAYKYVHDGTIPAVRFGRSIRVPVAAIEELTKKTVSGGLPFSAFKGRSRPVERWTPEQCTHRLFCILLGDEARISSQQQRVALMGIVNTELTDREARVLGQRFGLSDGQRRTLSEVALEFNVTSERIRQIEAKALRKLRHPSKSVRWLLKDEIEG